MPGNFKHIHIGKLIWKRMQECEVELERAINFLNVSESELEEMFELKSLDSEVLLRWSKLLKYDFFRIYSQHLILYSPQDLNTDRREQEENTQLPVFKKNIYTHELIIYLVELVTTGKKRPVDIQNQYNIPATTIFRWVNKYGNKK